MKIQIDQIPDTGLELSQTCEPSLLDLDRPDIKFKEPINIAAQVNKQPGLIRVKLKIEARMYLNCNRCLEEFVIPVFREIELNLPVEDKQVIDLTQNLREEIILNYPAQPLCKADCLGLCPSCGQNLNQGSCNC